MSSVKFILVDDRKGFWQGSRVWESAFPESISIRVEQFRHRDNAAAALLERLSAADISLDDRQWAEVCIVTDANFGHSNLDGAVLLESLYRGGKKWKRAVVYSDEPKLNDTCEALGPTIVRAVRKAVERDPNRIYRFFDLGIFPTLDPIWKLWQFLLPLIYCIEVSEANKEPLIFPKMRDYGMPESELAERDFPFTPLLVHNLTQEPILFATDTALFFCEESRSEFIQLATFSSHSQPKPSSISPEGQWRELLRTIDPFESLDFSNVSKGCEEIESGDGFSSVRMIWELVQTGGDPTLLLHQRAHELDGLKACERIWVRRRLGMLGDRLVQIRADPEDVRNLGRKCRKALMKIEQIRKAVLEAEQQISSGML